jgi:predicted ribosome quality control (RQC) complex YloA/Tae2 family protein
MELSGIELRYLVNEIKPKVTSGYYVSNITAVTKDSFLFKLHHTRDPDIIIMISARGIWITKLKFKQVEENTLIKTIKDEIERGKIESIEQLGGERIITIKFRHVDGKIRIIIAEFFGDGNIVLCDENMQILAILTAIEVRHRTLKVGLRYSPPPPRGIDVFDISLEQLQSKRSLQEKDLDTLRWMGRNISMPKKFVEEIAIRSGVEAKKVGQLSDNDINRIYLTIKEFVTNVISGRNHEPVIIIGEDGKAQDALPIITYNAAKLKIKRVYSYMDAIDEVLSLDIMDIGRNIGTIEIGKQIAILEHDLVEQNKAKEEVISKSTAIRKVAKELMTLLHRGAHSFNDDSTKELLAANSAIIVNEKGIKYLEVADERVQIECNNLPKVSSMLFARAKEMERGSVTIEESKAKLFAHINKLRDQTLMIHNKVVIKQQIAKEWYERYRWFITSDGFMAIGGRDASSNSALIRKHLTEHDIVFHAEVYGSPFFIIKNFNTTGEMEASLQQVAQATVSFSRAWKDGLFSADAYWVMPNQIKKGAPTGQFLPKGSFVIEGKRNYMKGIEIRLAVGIVQFNDNRYVLTCGPADAIKKRALIFAILLPGGMDPMHAAKKIKSEFVKVAADQEELAGFIKRILLDDFIRTIPPGQSKISFTGKGEEKVVGQSTTTRPLSSENEQSN